MMTKGKIFTLKEVFVDHDEINRARRNAKLEQLSKGFKRLSETQRWVVRLHELAATFNSFIEKIRESGHAFLDGALDAIIIEKGRVPVVQTFTPRENFFVWRTFRIGGDKEELIWRVKAVGVLNAQAENLVKRPTFITQPSSEDIDAIALTPFDLRLDEEEEIPTTTAELFNPERLKQWSKENTERLPYGHIIDLLPVETGLHVRIQYDDQPSGETLIIATEPVVDSDLQRGIVPYRFCVKRSRDGRKQSLEACRASLDTSWWPRIAQAHTPPPHILYRLRKVL